MSGLQIILNKASSIHIDRRKMVGIQYTRNQIPRTSLTPTRNPWRFTVEMPSSLLWWNNRSLIERLDNLDRRAPQIINFSDPCISWMFRYQGLMTSGQVSSLTVASFVGTQLTLSGLSPAGISTGTLMFEPGDLIQIGANPYPFTSVDRVVATSGNSVTFTVNRANFLSGPASVGAGIIVGPQCNFNMFCPNMPTYRIIPGGYKYFRGEAVEGVLNNGLIEFSGPFELYEWTGGAA